MTVMIMMMMMMMMIPRDTMMTDSHTPGGWFPGSYPMSRKHTDLITGAQSPPPGRRLASSPSPPPNRRNKYEDSKL